MLTSCWTKAATVLLKLVVRLERHVMFIETRPELCMQENDTAAASGVLNLATGASFSQQ